MPPLVLRMHSDIHLPDLCPQDLITPEIRSWHAWKEYFSAQYEKCGNLPKMTHRDTIRSSLEVHFYGNFVVVIHRGKEYLGTFSSRYVVPQKNNYSSIYMLYNVSCCRTIVHLHKDEKIHQANL